MIESNGKIYIDKYKCPVCGNYPDTPFHEYCCEKCEIEGEEIYAGK